MSANVRLCIVNIEAQTSFARRGSSAQSYSQQTEIRCGPKNLALLNSQSLFTPLYGSWTGIWEIARSQFRLFTQPRGPVDHNVDHRGFAPFDGDVKEEALAVRSYNVAVPDGIGQQQRDLKERFGNAS